MCPLPCGCLGSPVTCPSTEFHPWHLLRAGHRLGTHWRALVGQQVYAAPWDSLVWMLSALCPHRVHTSSPLRGCRSLDELWSSGSCLLCAQNFSTSLRHGVLRTWENYSAWGGKMLRQRSNSPSDQDIGDPFPIAKALSWFLQTSLRDSSITEGTTGPQDPPGACPGPLSSRALLGLMRKAPLLLASPHPQASSQDLTEGCGSGVPFPPVTSVNIQPFLHFSGGRARCGVCVRGLDALFECA